MASILSSVNDCPAHMRVAFRNLSRRVSEHYGNDPQYEVRWAWLFWMTALHTRTHAHLQTRTRTHICNTHTRLHMHADTYRFRQSNTNTRMHAHTHTHTHTHSHTHSLTHSFTHLLTCRQAGRRGGNLITAEFSLVLSIRMLITEPSVGFCSFDFLLLRSLDQSSSTCEIITRTRLYLGPWRY